MKGNYKKTMLEEVAAKNEFQDSVSPPTQPGDETWTFISELQAPLWCNHAWSSRAPSATEADLSLGVRVDARFPDPDELLTTAYADLSDFLTAGKVSTNGPFVIETVYAETSVFEAYRIEVTADRCRILAADTEGIRRGIFKIEDLMQLAGGPFLPLGIQNRKPFIKNRISRCFFGPIKRPPRFRDELMDDFDYYPNQYLNRLAHEGVNGLWLTVVFKELCRTSMIPEYDDNVERRIEKLRKTVERCRCYGIRIYLFSIEPRAWDANEDVLKRHPEMAGVPGDEPTFCPWPEASQRYLYEATNFIFTHVPHLGGLINISHGERSTTCQSVIRATSNKRTPCPVCSKKEPWEIIHATLTPMAKGINDANPDAELIAWFYMPQAEELGNWVYDIPKHFPKNVTFQFNFETGVEKEVAGRVRKGADYWISTPGPSKRFEQLATLARQSGTLVSAKIQTGCSHEVATVPFVPVPGLIYQKFRAMRELGISSVMLCWYFGNYPGIMNKAAGELSFEPFPETEEAFVKQLALIEWGKHAGAVAQALSLLAEGYSHYPLITEFQYWGPMHDGVVWPLHLLPQDTPLAPTWQIARNDRPHIGEPIPPSGDRIGEALSRECTLPEAVEACRAMSNIWDQGVTILHQIEADPMLPQQRRLDIGVARALGIQFRSGLNILQFYALRERMVHETSEHQIVTLEEMRRIVEAELKNDTELILLSQADSRLGFHSEAEGYKYFPAKIRWRMDQLQELLDKEIPALKRKILIGEDVFAEYAGRKPRAPCVRSRFCADIERRLARTSPNLPRDLDWQTCAQPQPNTSSMRWTFCHDPNAFYLFFESDERDPQKTAVSSVELVVEPRRLWTCCTYGVSLDGKGDDPWWTRYDYEAQAQADTAGWHGWIRVPFASLSRSLGETLPLALRINVRYLTGTDEHSWLAREPWSGRLRLSNENPADLSWLFFKQNCPTQRI